MSGGGLGVLSMTVWPTYAGATNERGEELLEHPDYQRGQIIWDVIDGEIIGHTRIHVPAGRYSHIVYFHHPTLPQPILAQQMAHPTVMPVAGNLDLDRITQADITPALGVHNVNS